MSDSPKTSGEPGYTDFSSLEDYVRDHLSGVSPALGDLHQLLGDDFFRHGFRNQARDFVGLEPRYYGDQRRFAENYGGPRSGRYRDEYMTGPARFTPQFSDDLLDVPDTEDYPDDGTQRLAYLREKYDDKRVLDALRSVLLEMEDLGPIMKIVEPTMLHKTRKTVPSTIYMAPEKMERWPGFIPDEVFDDPSAHKNKRAKERFDPTPKSARKSKRNTRT